MLMLKNEVKELFKKAGLEEFTVGRDSAGYLNIVGPCGKPLVGITNFSIGSKLSKAERTICINDHIVPVLAAHSKTILDLIVAKEEEVKAEEMYISEKEKASAGKYSIGFSIDHRYGSSDLNETYHGKVYMEQKNDIQNINTSVDYSSSDDKYRIETYCQNIADSSVATKLVKECSKIHEHINIVFAKYVKAVKTVREATEKLRIECSI